MPPDALDMQKMAGKNKKSAKYSSAYYRTRTCDLRMSMCNTSATCVTISSLPTAEGRGDDFRVTSAPSRLYPFSVAKAVPEKFWRFEN